MPGLRIFEPKSRRSRKADIERARRILAAKLTYIAHPSFDDPSAHDAILAPAPEPVDVETPGRIEPAAYRDSFLGGLSRGTRSRLASRRPTCSAR